MCCFDFRSNFLVSISFLINIRKEMSLPWFHRKHSVVGVTLLPETLYHLLCFCGAIPSRLKITLKSVTYFLKLSALF